MGTQFQHEVHLFLSVWVWVCTAKARGSLCLISFRQSLPEPEAGLTIKSQTSSCLYPAQGMLYMSKITGNLFYRCWGLHAHLRFSQLCSWLPSHHSSTPLPQHPTNPVGVVFVWDSVSQCLTTCYDGQDGLEFCCFLYSVTAKGKLAQHSECTCALAMSSHMRSLVSWRQVWQGQLGLLKVTWREE